ncbi:MAG: hypothetical protein A2664_01765 [Candidatus Taylorbacteria bacterium RIFCSPHIGHO2_01_FULL_46_22b]|uniref:Uncharacterized protein n=1 Tax=Candidatus Taylorbacteria bacterium RIFCSPHIGHO2_01_FULL_46_22b TaxID=1802301 RepID=A0A1G2M2U3_9BACT|nr:MAG: hypothetical protein A2664_01765 [Candidatus Taylorbacteria bacterium RIFCSPHIGHO2_01_FULL_46_22b]
MNTTDQPKPKVGLLTHNARLVAQAFDALNVWGTGEQFKIDPNPEQSREGRNFCVQHLIDCGEVERRSREHGLAV